MKRSILAFAATLFLLFAAQSVFAQTATVKNCTGAGLPYPGQTTNTCGFAGDFAVVSSEPDSFPTSCPMYDSPTRAAALTGGTLIATGNVITPIISGGQTVAVTCGIAALPAMAAGTHWLNMKGVNAKGGAGPLSAAPLELASSVYVPPVFPGAPTSLRSPAVGGSGPASLLSKP